MYPKGDMSKMLKKVQLLQEKMAKAQNELNQLRAEGQSGGGMVTVVANGKKDIVSVKIDPEVMQEDVEFVEDLIFAAVNQALEKASDVAEEKMNSVSGGMLGGLKIPGL